MRSSIAVVLLIGACGGSSPPASSPGGADDVDDVEDLDRGSSRVELTPARESSPAVSPAAVAIRRAPARRPGRRVYRGRRIDLDARDMALGDLYRLLATVGGVNIVIAPEVRGHVTLRLRQVPWDQVAHVVARSQGLEIERDRGVWLIRKRQTTRR